MLKENKGVTLVALVITIIVLLILAGVTLSMVMGESGIFGKANKASVNTNLSSAKDAIRLAVLEVSSEQYSDTDGSFTAITNTTSTGIEAEVNKHLDEYIVSGEKVYKKDDTKENKLGEAVNNENSKQLKVTFKYGTNKSITPEFKFAE